MIHCWNTVKRYIKKSSCSAIDESCAINSKVDMHIRVYSSLAVVDLYSRVYSLFTREPLGFSVEATKMNMWFCEVYRYYLILLVRMATQSSTVYTNRTNWPSSWNLTDHCTSHLLLEPSRGVWMSTVALLIEGPKKQYVL